jgi:hypothetical protein
VYIGPATSSHCTSHRLYSAPPSMRCCSDGDSRSTFQVAETRKFRRMERFSSSKGAATGTSWVRLLICLVALGHVQGFVPVGLQLMQRQTLGGAGVCGMGSTVGRRSRGGRHHGGGGSGSALRCAIIDQEDELSKKVWPTPFHTG